MSNEDESKKRPLMPAGAFDFLNVLNVGKRVKGDGELALLPSSIMAIVGQEVAKMATNSVIDTRGHVFCLRFSPDGANIVASIGLEGEICVFDSKTGVEKMRMKLKGHVNSVVSELDVSPGGDWIVSVNNDCGHIAIWNGKTGALKTQWKNDAGVLSVAISPDGKTLVTGTRDHLIHEWTLETGKYQRTFKGHTDWVRSVAFSADGKSIVSASDDSTVRVWDVRYSGMNSKEITMIGHYGWVYSVAFFALVAGGEKVVSCGDDTVRIWNAKTGICEKILKGHTKNVMFVAVSSNGAVIFSGSCDNTVRMWDADTGQCQKVMTGHSMSVIRVAISPDGNTVASGGNDKSIILWDAKTGIQRKWWK